MSPVSRKSEQRSEVVVELTKSELIDMVKKYYFETVPETATLYTWDMDRSGLPSADDALITFSWTETK